MVPCPGHDRLVVVGRHDGEVALGGNLLGARLALERRRSLEDHLGPELPRPFHLVGRSGGRHDDDGRHAGELGGERDGEAVVARREGDDAGAAGLVGKLRHHVVGAAQLEGAGRVQVLALEEEARAVGGAERIERRQFDERRASCDVSDSGGGFADGIERQEFGHAEMLTRRV